jgi:hypothetical protein
MLGPDGQLAWEVVLPKFRGITSDVETVFPADLNGDGRAEIVCGCASWQYFALDAAGKQLWSNVIYAHSATVGQAADVDGDGKQEVIAGNEYYCLNLIGHDGKRLWSTGSIGPEMTAVGAVNVDADPQPEILVGVDGGYLHCFDGDGKELWRVNLGDRVTRIIGMDVNGDGRDEIVCSAESSHVFAVGRDGAILWRTGVPDGAADLAVTTEGTLVAAAGSGGIIELDKSGKPMAAGTTGARIERVLSCGDRAVAVTSDGKVVAWNLR